MGDWFGFYSYPVINSSGATTRVTGVDIENPDGTGPIGTLYGIRIKSQTRGSTNYAIVTEGSAPSIFGGSVTLSPAASATPASNGQLTFEATSNTSLTVKLKGTDGTVRSVVLTLAP